jgi:DNA invertase Pin-like site-specific DNA recombinase
MLDKKYFIYTRISDLKYKDSISNQKDVIIKLALKDWIPLENLVFVEEEKSGAESDKREKFNEMINKLQKDLTKNKWKPENRIYGWIYFFKIDRLARNDKDFQTIFNLLDAGYTFKSATETIENTPTWRLLFRMLSSFAIFESEKLSNRESIANIHNLMLKKFKSLWGSTIIFWYKLDKDDKIKINEIERKIIIRIYETFLMWKENNSKITYKEIFKLINNEFDWYLKKYLINKSKSPDEWRFIENILKNENMLQYNWYIERKLSINDELIKNYIESIIEKKNEYFEIIWWNKIWWKIKFSFSFKELVIVNDILYDQVRNIIKSNKNWWKRIQEKKFFWLFEDIIYFKKWKQLYTANPYYNSNKNTYNYRRTVNKQNYEISEKTAIENKIKASWIIDKILSLSDSKILIIRNNLKDIEKKQSNEDIKRLKASKNIYQYILDRSEYMLWEVKTKKEILFYTKQVKKYKEKLQYIEEEINCLENDQNINIEKFINLFSIKSLFSEDIYTKRDFFITMIDKVIYDENKEVTIILPDFLVELWLAKRTII